MSVKRGPVGLSKVGGEFDVGYRGAKKLRKDMAGKTIKLEREYYDKKKKKKSKKSKLSFKQKLLKALKIPFKTIAKVGGGVVGAASELVLPDEVGAPTLPKGYHSWSPKKKAAFANSFK